jgi:formate hydrogenlyase subunit 4
MENLTLGLLQLFVIFALAPLIKGIIHKTKCYLRGQRCSPVWQGYKDVYRLIKKEAVLSKDATWISRFAPYMVFVSAVVVACFLPVFSGYTLLSFTGDIIALVYVLALGTFFLALYGMDQGSAFGGLGSSREMTIAALAEPALMMIIFTFALQTGSTNISEIFSKIHEAGLSQFPVSSVLALIALLIVALAEKGRMPIDNPETHLELTMVHEAMILEASGRHLALFEMASWLKLIIFLTLASNIFIPFGFYKEVSLYAVIFGIVFYLVKIIIFAIPIAFIEISMAKLRFFRVPDVMTLGFILALISLVLYYL